MTKTALRLAATTALVVTLLSTGTTASVLAAKGDKKADPPPGPIGTVKGNKIKMAGAKVADHVTRIADAVGDQVKVDGSPAIDAPAYSDLAAVHVSPIKVPQKLLTKMEDDFPRGAVGAFYGADADWSKLERAVFVAAELGKKRPKDPAGQQVEIGLAGDGASPVQVGAFMDTTAGIERLSLSGLFGDGTESSGTTDVSGRTPGDPIEFYNTESRVFGFYDPGKATYFLIMPLRGDNEAVAVTLRTSTDHGVVLDRLELPSGGHLVDLGDPAAGFDQKGGSPPLGCRSLETFSGGSGVVSLDDPAATLIRYSAAADSTLDAAAAQEALSALDDYEDSIPLMLTRLDSEEAPFTVDADLTKAPALDAFSVSVEVPPGAWSFSVPEGIELLSPSGEALIDHTALTGQAGLRTGEGLDGFVSGDPDCVRPDGDEASPSE